MDDRLRLPLAREGELHEVVRAARSSLLPAVLAVGFDNTVIATSDILTVIRRGSTKGMLAKILGHIGAKQLAFLR